MLTFAACSDDLTQMFWLRFFAGLGIGGVIPNIVAINAELAPRRTARDVGDHRRRIVPTGGALPDFHGRACPALWLAGPVHFGGVVPSLSALGFFGLPELIKYMALHESGGRNGKIGRIDPTGFACRRTRVS